MATDEQNGTNNTRAHISTLCIILLLNCVALCFDLMTKEDRSPGFYRSMLNMTGTQLLFGENGQLRTSEGISSVSVSGILRKKWSHQKGINIRKSFFVSVGVLISLIVFLASGPHSFWKHSFLEKQDEFIMALKWFIVGPLRLSMRSYSTRRRVLF